MNPSNDELKETKELWNILLNLALELKRICDKYRLKYFLHDGSLLGAIRHGGFIPWDDDMDFIMPRSDFEKFIKLATYEIKPPFYLQTVYNEKDIFNNGQIVLRVDDTTYVRTGNDLYSKDHQGIGIDILALDNCPDDIKLRDKQWKKIDKYFDMLYMKKNVKSLKIFSLFSFEKLKTMWMYCISKVLPYSFLKRQLNKYFVLYNDVRTNLCTVNNEAFKYSHKIFNKKFFSEAIMKKFENYSFPVPVQYNKILEIIYGKNYMELPPEAERIAPHRVLLNTHEAYNEVLKHFQNIFKNTSNKQIVVFGAGQMFKHYLGNTKKKYRPEFVVDNDSKKWNTTVNGYKVCNPNEILNIPKEKQYVIICSIYYKEIIEQLKNMGIENYYIYVQNIKWL